MMEFMIIEKTIPYCCLEVRKNLTKLEAIELSSISSTYYSKVHKIKNSELAILNY